ncbi:CHASE2 domain-containing protein [Calditrichota bacterium]
MKRLTKHLPILTGTFVVVVIAIFSLLGVFDRVERIAWDSYNRFAGGWENPDPRILLVAIDQSSLDSAARWGITWPWPRDMWARLIEIAEENEAQGIMFDILFDDPGIDRFNSSSHTTDQMFANKLDSPIPIVIAAHLAPTGLPLGKAPPNVRWHGENISAYQLEDNFHIRLPYESFQSANLAAANIFAEEDGVIRSIPLVCALGTDSIPTMAFKMANLISKKPLAIPPVDEYGKLWIRFYGRGGGGGAFEYIPAFDLIVGKIDPEVLRGRILVVGGYASGLLDYQPTPLASVKHQYPGFELQATAISNLLNQHSLIPISSVSSTLVVLIIGFVGLFSVGNIRKLWLQLATLLMIGIGYLSVSLLAFDSGWLLPAYSPLTACYLGVGFQFYTSWQLEGRRRLKLQKLFSRYLENSVIEDLLGRDDDSFLKGEAVDATIMFTDMVNFTNVTEKLSPEQTVDLLNAYHSVFVEIALTRRGMLDKYIGDAVMVIFGAPIKQEDSSLQAVKTIFEAQTAFQDLTKKRELDNLPSLGIRLGVHTAKVVMGNIGHERRMDYTAIGAGVNIASRLEGANRHFDTQNMVSEQYCQTLPDEIQRREIARVLLKGLTEPMRVFEMLPEREAGDWIEEWRLAWELFREGKRSEAMKKWQNVAMARPDDAALKNLLKRLADAETDVVELTSK